MILVRTDHLCLRVGRHTVSQRCAATGHSSSGAAWGCGDPGMLPPPIRARPAMMLHCRMVQGPTCRVSRWSHHSNDLCFPQNPTPFFVHPTTEAGGRSPSADPMVIEADDLGLPGHDVTTVSKAAITPDAVRPSFEMVTFPESGPVLHEVDEDATVRASPNNLSLRPASSTWCEGLHLPCSSWG
jgi:hypothetical protein